MGKVLLVDDDPMMLELLREELAEAGIATLEADSGKAALKLVEEEEPVAVLLDLVLPDIHGREVLQQLQEDRPELPVVIITTHGEVDEVVDCMKQGATDFLQKPVDQTRLVTTVKNARRQGMLRQRVERLESQLNEGKGFQAILGESKALKKALDLLARAAETEVTVLLEGASGTGKEIAARAIHNEGSRAEGPFVAVNCGAIPETLIESELFGHEEGAFTGASSSRRGYVEQADGGTLFLDEIGELRSDLQVRLLRVLQERRIHRVGAESSRPVDVRVIAATNRDLRAAVEEDLFRPDLYYRLAVFPVDLPPLTDRAGDILLLAEAFLERFSSRHRKEFEGFTDRAREALRSYDWPGNVRELENVVERAVILEDGSEITLGSLTDEVVSALGEPVCGRPPVSTDASLDDILPFEEEERRIVLRALHATGWSVKEAANRLGIGRATIYRKIEKYDLSAHRSD